MAVATGTAILGAAIIGGGAAAYSAHQQSKAAGRAHDQTQEVLDAERARQAQFAPVEQALIKEATTPLGQSDRLSQLLGEVDNAYGDAIGQTRASTSQRLPWGGGLKENAIADLELKRGVARGDAFRQASNDRLKLLMDTASIGRGLSPTGQLIPTLRAGEASERKAAGDAWGSAGNTAGNLLQLYMLSEANKPNTQSLFTKGATQNTYAGGWY